MAFVRSLLVFFLAVPLLADLSRIEARKPRMRPMPLAKAPDGGKTIAVDCTKGESIQQAVDQAASGSTIEIHGLCTENVLVSRKELTLRGADPLTDGIQGAAGADAALLFRYTQISNVANLSVNGPTTGIALQYSGVLIDNCRLSNNGTSGLHVSSGSYTVATSCTLDNNQFGLNVQRNSLAFCIRCTLTGNTGWAARALTGGFLSLLDSTVNGRNGLLSVNGSYADIDCVNEGSTMCSMNATGRAALASAGGMAALFVARDFTGQVSADDHGEILLYGARQLATGQPGQGPNRNGVDSFATLWLEPYVDGTTEESRIKATHVDGFSRALVRGNAVIDGFIQCGSAGDAWLEPGVTGTPGTTVTGCEHASM